MTHYPHIARLGLDIYSAYVADIGVNHLSNVRRDVVRADKLEQLLASAPVVWGFFKSPKPGEMEMHHTRHEWSTHSALLLGIQPVAPPDTAESLLIEMLEKFKRGDTDTIKSSTNKKWIERAEKVLGRGD